MSKKQVKMSKKKGKQQEKEKTDTKRQKSAQCLEIDGGKQIKNKQKNEGNMRKTGKKQEKRQK